MIPDIIRKEYRQAIRKGFLDDYNELWTFRTFVGCFLQNKACRKCIKVLEKLREIIGDVPTFGNITDDCLISLRCFYENEVNEGRLSPNSMAQYLRYVRIALEKAPRSIRLECEDYKRLLQCKTESVQDIYLSEEEIMRIDNYNPKDEKERAVKALFLRECYCGARTSECKKMTKDNIHGDTITYFAEKNNSDVTLPLHSRLKKYLEEDVINVSAQEANEIIRLIGARCGINEPVTLHRKGKTETKPKFAWLHTHVGRKSFVSNLYMRDAEPIEIQRLVGHKSLQTTLRYIVPTRKLKAQTLEFFHG